jgi:hypothetical protein
MAALKTLAHLGFARIGCPLQAKLPTGPLAACHHLLPSASSFRDFVPAEMSCS